MGQGRAVARSAVHEAAPIEVVEWVVAWTQQAYGSSVLSVRRYVRVLELATGGLADALGRRPVLVASGLLHVGSCAAYATADGVPGFVLASFLLGAR